MRIVKKLFFVSVIFFCDAYADKKDTLEQVKMGNLTLSSSQQPSSLWGIGQNIVDKGDLQAFLFSDVTLQHRNSFDIGPSILYGIRDNLSFFMQWPSSVRFGFDGRNPANQTECIVQLEYAWYTQETKNATEQATLITSLLFPLGKDNKDALMQPDIVSFLFGFTVGHWSTEWYCYTSGALEIPFHYNNIKPGKQILYQTGLGKNIAYKAESWIFTLLLELNGTYTQKEKTMDGVTVSPASNIILLGPSLWFSTKDWTLQAGVASAVCYSVKDRQSKRPLLISFYCGYKLH